ncbi:protein-disulfide reductase DsbD domain-containing protein [Paracidovorax citrulli]|uniref:protein-disulfide reductase DsbD domain-containing protein n=1 Tax=Paracidovorax citrulli TaxID=80869 RepID=UPI003FA70D19
MLRRLRIAALATTACAPGLCGAQFNLNSQAPLSNRVVTPHVRAELVAHAPEGLATGKPFWLGLALEHQPEWHTYWINPGDAGLPTQLTWTLPTGMTAGAIEWPLPRRFPFGHLVNYGYDGFVLLPVPVAISSAFRTERPDATIRLRAAWLMCRKECIPEEGEFVLTLPMRGATTARAADFAAAATSMPEPSPVGVAATARMDGTELVVTAAGLPLGEHGKDFQIFPEVPGLFQASAVPIQRWNGHIWTARIPLAPHHAEVPDTLPLVLASVGKAWRINFAFSMPAKSAKRTTR